MRRNHQPYWLSALLRRWNRFYCEHFVAPQFDKVGLGLGIYEPRHLEIFGRHIELGKHIHIISSKNAPVSIGTWSSKQDQGHICIDDYSLISPGVKILSAQRITIGKNCMIAAEAYISDSDWHGIYNRTRPFRCHAPVKIDENVWIGFRAIIGKGIHIGKNSVVAAGSVVVDDVPENTVVGGNPAKIIKTISPNRRMVKRDFLFEGATDYDCNQTELNRFLALDNRTWKWLKTLYAPSRND